MVLMGCSCGQLEAQSAVEETMTVLQEWVQTEKNIADSAAKWGAERESLLHLQELYEAELSMLTEQIEESQGDVSAAEIQRSQLNSRSDRLKEIEDAVNLALADSEAAVLVLNEKLPAPLREELRPVVSQIPRDSKDVRISIGQRVQFLVMFLTQVQKFNTAVTVAEDFREFEGGDQVQVDAIYFGLGAAYYVDKTDKHAGYATLNDEGWDWKDDATFAPAVRKAVEIYRSNKQAAFVELPIEIK